MSKVRKNRKSLSKKLVASFQQWVEQSRSWVQQEYQKSVLQKRNPNFHEAIQMAFICVQIWIDLDELCSIPINDDDDLLDVAVLQHFWSKATVLPSLEECGASEKLKSGSEMASVTNRN